MHQHKFRSSKLTRSPTHTHCCCLGHIPDQTFQWCSAAIPSCGPGLKLMLVSISLWKWSENPPTTVLKVSYFEETLGCNKKTPKKTAHRKVHCAGRACGSGGWVCIASIYPFKIQRGSKLIFFSKFHRCCFINRKPWDVQRRQGAKLPVSLNFNDSCIP